VTLPAGSRIVNPVTLPLTCPGDEAWVVGDEPFIRVDFGGYAQYAKGDSGRSRLSLEETLRKAM
jgi:hypothetical protein